MIKNDCCWNVHILFDSGAQRSYVTIQKVQTKLSLKPVRVEKIVYTFLIRMIGKLWMLDVVKSKIETITDKVFMEALRILIVLSLLIKTVSMFYLKIIPIYRVWILQIASPKQVSVRNYWLFFCWLVLLVTG